MPCHMLDKDPVNEHASCMAQVLFHLSIRDVEANLIHTTRPEEGGSSIPQAFVIGRGKRCPRGWELALEGR